MATMWDMLGMSGADNMSAFGSPDPLAEQLVVPQSMPTDQGLLNTPNRFDLTSQIENFGEREQQKDMQQVQQFADNQMAERKPMIDAQTMKRVLSGEITLAEAALPGRQLMKTPKLKRGDDEADPSYWDKFKQGASDYFGDEENMANLAMGLNSMRLNPDQTIGSAMAAKAESARKGKKSKLNTEAVVASLIKMGRQDLASAVAQGVMKPETAVEMAFKKTKPSALQEKMALFKSDPEAFADMKKAGVIGGGGTTVNVGGQTSEGWKAIDKKFADDYIKWTGGGAADTVGNLAKIQDVLTTLERGDKITGPIIGQLPDFVMAFLNPEAVASREAVEGVVQRNLKAVLGAQFTEKEGEKLIKRAFNPTLSGPENAKRLKVLIQQINIAAEQKSNMAAYFREHGTLSGYEGEIPTVSDFHQALDIIPSTLTRSQEDLLKKYNLN